MEISERGQMQEEGLDVRGRLRELRSRPMSWVVLLQFLSFLRFSHSGGFYLLILESCPASAKYALYYISPSSCLRMSLVRYRTTDVAFRFALSEYSPTSPIVSSQASSITLLYSSLNRSVIPQDLRA